MRKRGTIVAVAGIILLAGCAEEVPPISVQEFVDKPRLLEATMVRCSENRSAMKYDAECVNAREAVNRIEAAEEKERREHLEAQSERKRQALRRNQEAAAEARRRALEAQRMREEEEYLGLFEQSIEEPHDALPQSQLSEDWQEPAATVAPHQQTDTTVTMSEPAPMQQRIIENDARQPETEEEVAADLKAIREELQRRRDEQQAKNQ